MDAASLLSWLVTIVHILLALAFGGICLARIKRLGTGGALLLLGVALLDILVSLAFRLFSIVAKSMPGSALEAGYDSLTVASALTSLLSALLILVGLILVGRVPPEPA